MPRRKGKPRGSLEVRLLRVREAAETDPSAAIAELEKIVRDFPESAEALEMLGELLVDDNVVEEYGDDAILKAREVLQAAIKLEPQKNATKFFNLAAISHCDDALRLYNDGILVARKDFETATSIGADARCTSIKRQIARAFVSMAETVQHKVADEDLLNQESIRFFEAAVAECPSDRGVRQSFASFYLGQARRFAEKAKLMIHDPSALLDHQRKADDFRNRARSLIIESCRSWITRIDELMDHGSSFCHS
jgi:tetratricopeptide (TPR) repeat protein